MIGSRRSSLIFSAVAVFSVVGSSLVQAEEPKPKPVYDCGTIALYHLLRWEGYPTSLQELEAALPPCPVEGYSMKELRDAAGRLGLRLEGIQLPGGSKPPERPALAFLKNGDHGHYVVVRPVGHSGSLVQVADLDLAPSVVEASKLYARSHWTGMVLTRDQPTPWRVVFQCLTIVGSVLSALWLVKRRKTRTSLAV